MHLADAFIQSNLQCIQVYIFSMCVPWELNPQTFALLTQCSTTEPQEHSRQQSSSLDFGTELIWVLSIWLLNMLSLGMFALTGICIKKSIRMSFIFNKTQQSETTWAIDMVGVYLKFSFMHSYTVKWVIIYKDTAIK